MKYFYDFEFHEHFVKTGGFWNSRYTHTIEPMQLGMVCEDGRSINVWYNDFDVKAAWNNPWILENVITPLFKKNSAAEIAKAERIGVIYRPQLSLGWFSDFIRFHGKSRNEICGLINDLTKDDRNVRLFGYYSDYDHVCLANTYGKMISMPNHLPMYTVDTKQMYDEFAFHLSFYSDEELGKFGYKKSKLKGYKFVQSHPAYPINAGEHDALNDAMWIMKLYNFIKFNTKQIIKA